MDYYFLGIDPGQSGAIAILDENQKVLLLEDWPGDEVALNQLMIDFYGSICTDCDQNIAAAVESVHAMPKQGVSSMFKFGKNVGMWLGLLAAHGISTSEPTPRTWQKGLTKKIDGNSTKERSLTVARRLFPSQAAKLKRKRDNGRSDALLIAYWLLIQHRGGK